MSNWIESYYQETHALEQQIYQHLLDLVQVESASQMIARCRALFIEGLEYPQPKILSILDTITACPKAEQEFRYFLNRCYHILINRWHMQPQLHGAIPELISLFASEPSRSIVHSFRYKHIRRLHELVKQFTASEQYSALRRLSQVIVQSSHSQSKNEHKQLLSLIPRYPYLYEHCLIAEDCSSEQQRTVKKIQSQVQRKFEIDLSQYTTYLLRRSQIVKHTSEADASRILQPATNPTLLSDRELNASLKHFIGRVSGRYTYKDLAQQFLHYSSQNLYYEDFKNGLYEYLVSSIDGEYGKRQFNQRLYSHLKNILPNANDNKVDEFLIVRTCSNLLNFLVVESQASPQHFTFVDMISNQGTILTTGLLLKIVLICRKIKPYLEKRFAILFNHYEAATTNGIQWLVRVLEQLNVAFSIHFGSIDLSYLKQAC